MYVAETPTLLDLALTQVSELVDCSSLAGNSALYNFDRACQEVLRGSGVCDGFSLDFDKTDSGILWATIVLAITEVSKPCLQGR